jgi:hypothetical protein
MFQRQAAEGVATRYPAARVITTVAVVTVALIAAVVSYSHMHDLAASVGEHWRSYLIPISIDGMIVAASMTLLTRHRAGLKGSALAWIALIGGVIASVAANMADARDSYVAILLAGSAPLVFAIGFELLLLQRHADRITAGMPSPATASASPDPASPKPPESRTGSTPPTSLPVPPPPQSAPRRAPGVSPVATSAQREIVSRPRPTAVPAPRRPLSERGLVQRSEAGKRSGAVGTEASLVRKQQAWAIFDDIANTGVQRPTSEICQAVGVATRQLARYKVEWAAARKDARQRVNA